jgi:hypothetical protein
VLLDNRLMNRSTVWRILNYGIASVWIANGLFCKLLNLVPRHQRIVARILGRIGRPFESLWNVVRFNWPMYAASLGLALFFLLLSLALHGPYRLGTAIACLLLIVTAVSSLLVTFYVYDLSGIYRMDWAGQCPPRASIVNVHAFFVALTVFLMGLLCLTSAREITSTQLGRRVALGLALFWTARLLIQFFGYAPALWKGKALETTVHVAFVVFWAYLSAIFIGIRLTPAAG